MARLWLAQESAADDLLDSDPLALLIAMLLDQQIPLDKAFVGPYRLAQRLGVPRLDPITIAEYDPEQFAQIFATPPAIHRFPGAMAARTQKLCQGILTDFGGDPAAVWTGAASGADLLKRVAGLPGFGKQKAQIFVALLGKQFAVQPAGWREAAGGFGDHGVYRSVADITDADSLTRVRDHKKQMKAEAKAAKGG